MAFFQDPPQLPNPYTTDRVLREYLTRNLPQDMTRELEEELTALGERVSNELWHLSLEHRREEPELIQWDAWGNRIDEIRVPEIWNLYARLAAEEGLVARGYGSQYGAHSRIDQFVRAYLVDRVTHTYNCPLAMTDGSAKILKDHAPAELRDRALSKLLSRDGDEMWTAGQWMTERTGGSDVGICETIARQTPEGWRLHGTKWFTSATTSQMALTLARPEGNPKGGRGLALFYLEQRDANGNLNHIRVHRLKEKLGTKMLPTAELSLEGTLAHPVMGLENGTRNISPLLNITRTWNSVVAVACMRHGIALARDYAQRRRAFGATLAEKPLHVDTLASMQAEFEGAFHLTFHLVHLLGKEEHGEATNGESQALRLLFPLVKLLTGKQAVANASETIESFGGAGYVEDTGIPQLLRDTQVLSIWEGTTNVLSLDGLRAIAKDGALEPFLAMITQLASAVESPELKPCAEAARQAALHGATWLQAHHAQGNIPAMEAGARRFALTLGRALSLALLTEHADAMLRDNQDPRASYAAQRYLQHGVDQITEEGLSEDAANALGNDQIT